MAKRGPLSRDEQKFLAENAAKFTPKELAEQIDRREEMVRTWLRFNKHRLKAQPRDEAASPEAAKLSLRKSQAWKRLSQKFTEEELKLFEERWVDWVDQFRDDMVASEEQQIMKVITYEILMDRNLVERRRAREDIDFLKKQQRAILDPAAGNPSDLSDADKERLLSLETQITTSREADKSMTKEYVDLEGKQQALMKDLKATRDQRVSRIESGKQSWIGIVKELDREEERQRVGRQMELMRVATSKEETRLGSPHKYQDDNEDLPILSADTVERLDAANAAKERKEDEDLQVHETAN